MSEISPFMSLSLKKGCVELNFRCHLCFFRLLKALHKYLTVVFCLFVCFLMYVAQKKGMNQTSPVSALKTQDNLRQPQLTSLLSNTLSGQLRSF